MEDSDSIYKSMIDHIEDYAIFHLDIHGDILTWNPGAEKIKGYGALDIIGKNFSVFYTNEDQKNNVPQNILKEAARNGKYQQEGWRVRRDGTMFWGNILIMAHYDNHQQVTGFTKVAHDLTEKRRLQGELYSLNARLEEKVGLRDRELRENEAKYRHLFASNPLPMWLFDLQTFKFLDVNDMACVHYGYSREEFLTMSVQDIRPANQKELFAKADHPSSLHPEQYHRGTWQHLKKDGSRIDVEIAAHDILFEGKNARMIVVHDVTQRKRTEEKLRQNEFNLEHAQRMAHFGHWQHSFATGKSIWSAEGCRIYGVDLNDNEHSYESWLSFIHPDDLDEVIRQNTLAQQTFGRTEYHHRIVLRDGTIKHLFSQSHYEFDANGNPIGLYGVSHDVTEQKIAEQKIVSANRLYAVLSSINQLIVHTEDEETLFRQACCVATEKGKYDLAWVGMVDEGGTTMRLLAHSNASTEDLDYINDIAYEKNGPIARLLRTGSYQCLNDTQYVPAGSKIRDFIADCSYKSFMFLPLVRSGMVYATLNLFSYQRDCFDTDEILLLEEVAGDISFALNNIQKRKQAEQGEKKLQHNELRLRQAQSIAHVGNWELDFSVGLAIWSEEHCRIYGLDPADNLHSFESWLTYIHPEDLDFVRSTIEGSEKSYNHASFHHRIVRKDGSIRHIYMHSQYEINAAGEPVGLYGVSHDVTESKEAEDSLVQSEANVRLIMDLLPQRIFVKGLDGRYLFVNKSFAELYGMSPKETITASGTGQLFKSHQVDTFTRDDRQVISEGRKKIIPEENFVGPSGERKIFHVTKLPYFWGRDRRQSVLGILNDITEQKKAEAERNTLLADIVRRNESLEQFAYIISHNLRAPVANILALSDLLQLVKDDPTETEKLLQNLSRSTVKLDEVISDLNKILQSTHQTSEKKQDVSFSDICADVRFSLAGVLADDDVEIDTDFSAIEQFYGVKSYLYSIFHNLISNSIKYRKPNTTVLIKICSRTDNDKIELIFKDNGLGLDLGRIDGELFGLYKRFHSHVEGKGMGLYMVKRHVDMMDGEISVQSEPGKGTTFTILFSRDLPINERVQGIIS